jgi:hypothetical protein
MTDGLLSAVGADTTADVCDATSGIDRRGYALRTNRFCGVRIAPRRNVTNRAPGPIWLSRDTKRYRQ